MKIGSLFSGIGGLELGLEKSIPNAQTVWQVERDPYARRVLAKNWPGVAMFEDVRAVGAHNLEPVDLICGGFPCTDISFAGKGAGINGERSGLWREFSRIISEIRPRYAVVENVPALLNRGMGRVLGDLAESGYHAQWDCIPAAAVGAHHRRDRLFIVAHTHSEWKLQPKRPVKAKRGRFSDSRSTIPDTYSEHERFGDDGNAEVFRSSAESWKIAREIQSTKPWPIEPGVGRVAYGVPNGVDRLRALGNAVVPQVAEVIGRVIVDLEGQKG